ncbi:MAG: hypothetical protein U1B78_04860 [Dehalococcoidia bacterium]|nr:hypothetical protein [Dehalococcoidia bacterium]
MGREQLEALAKVIGEQLALGTGGVVVGTWSIRYDKDRNAFEFDKCEVGGYCEERPSVIAADGTVLDPGGPLLRE